MRLLFATPARLFRTASALVVLLMTCFSTGAWLLLAAFTAEEEAPAALLVISTVGLLFTLATAVFGLTRHATVPLVAALLLLVPMLSLLVSDGDELSAVVMAGLTMAPPVALIIALCVATCLENGPWAEAARTPGTTLR
ncbi:MAG: hypothetical protein L0G99_04470 [Propionibacteriales bacterium]|nr:hypothetical protein [Propionibacteriales bacterium]